MGRSAQRRRATAAGKRGIALGSECWPEAASPDSPMNQQTPAQLNPEPPLILLIEDERPLLDLEAHVLEHFGYRVRGFGSGQEALAAGPEVLGEARLALVDAVFGGLETVLALRRINPQIKTVIVTGAEFEPHPEIDRIMPLPFQMEGLLHLVRELLA